MRAELSNLNHSAVSFLSRVAVNLCWYYYTPYCYRFQTLIKTVKERGRERGKEGKKERERERHEKKSK